MTKSMLDEAGLREQYIQLIMKTLSFSLWQEEAVPLHTSYRHRRLVWRSIGTMLSTLVRPFGYTLYERTRYADQQKFEGYIWPTYADTMIGTPRLENIRDCILNCFAENVPGDFIEAGVWRGGGSIFMAAILNAYQISDRKIFVADSFQGLPPPDAETYPADKGDKHSKYNKILSVSLEEVQRNFEKYDLLHDNIVFVPGWFKDTLPTLKDNRFAVIRLDGDMYGSTIESLDNLYPLLSVGGYCIIDDYALDGCRKAVDDYRARFSITEPIISIDWTGAYWKKEVDILSL
ncbi:MAG: TylF/MycF/NovP-related O-methyltransferase [Chloroflexota bacterium]